MNDEISRKLDDLLLMQQELMTMVMAMYTQSFLPDPLPDDDELIDANEEGEKAVSQ